LLILKEFFMEKAVKMCAVTPFLPAVSLCLVCFIAGPAVFGQDSSVINSLNKKIGVYIFPAKNQTPEQQLKDESDCYQWAVTNSGTDPLNMQAVKPDSSKGVSTAAGTVAGGAKGAVAGAAVGAITGDAGTGAAVGATAGAVGGRRAAKKAQKAQKQQSEQNAAAATQGQVDNFTKAYKACLTGKEYTVQ
jgi:hypothetical protein